MSRLRDASGDMAAHVAATLDALEPHGADDAARELAKHYAFVIDESSGHCHGCDDGECRRGLTSAWLLRWIGPLLLDALKELGATPAARAALAKGKPDTSKKPGGLQALRDARGA